MRIRSCLRSIVAQTPIPELVVRQRARVHLTIVGYHRVVPALSEDYPFNEELVSANPQQFRRELQYYARNFDVLSVSELVACLQKPGSLPARPAIITFDDGYADNAEYALPLLKEAGIRACFFICTGMVGTWNVPWYEQFVCCLKLSNTQVIPSPFGEGDPSYRVDEANLRSSIQRFRQNLRRVSWAEIQECLHFLRATTGVDPQTQLRQPLFMSWQAVDTLIRAGMEIGGHTRTHPILSRVEDPETLSAEIAGCRLDIQRQLGYNAISFSYPVGLHEAMSASADEHIRQAGFMLSFSYCNSAAPRIPKDLYRIPRIHTGYRENYAGFRVGMARVLLSCF